jgi:chromosome segregation ATPase
MEVDSPEEESYVLPKSGSIASGLELELSAVDQDLVADRVRPEALSNHTMQSMSAFGKVEPGVVGAVKYWIRVRKRLKEIRTQLVEGEEKKRVAIERRIALEVELGRSILRLQVISSSIAPLIQSALTVERDFKARESSRSSHILEHRKQQEALEAEIEKTEILRAPHKAIEATLLEEKKALDQKKRGFETTKKRCRIDLQNTETLLAQKRASQNAPDVDKSKLASDIIAFESKRQSLTDQIAGIEKSLSDLALPFSTVETKLEKVRADMKPFDDKCAQKRSEIDSLNETFAQTDSKEADAVHQEAERVSSAWSEAGRQAIKERFSHPELTKQQSQVIAATKEAYDASSTVEMLTSASNSYDRNAIKTAKFAVGAAALALVVIVIIMSVVL